MAQEYICNSCLLKVASGSDHLEDENGHLAWLTYLSCKSCGTVHRILSAPEGEYMVDAQKRPFILKDKAENRLMNYDEWEILDRVKGSAPGLDQIQCNYCKKTGEIINAPDTSCPNCKKNTLELEVFYMT